MNKQKLSISIISWIVCVMMFYVAAQEMHKTQTSYSYLDADLTVKVFVSQYGFNPEHPKIVHYKGDATMFSVKNALSDKVVFSGELRSVTCDFGTFCQGDFSEFREEGDYYIQINNDRSPGIFSIRFNRWDNLQKYSAFYYFGLRRMGEDNVMGNLGDYRLVNWEHGRIPVENGNLYKYIGKAWGDGGDGRTYPSVSLVVAQYCALKETNPFWDNNDWIYSQVRWGLDGTLSYLEKDGLLHWMQAARPDHQTKTYDNKLYSGDEKILVNAFDVLLTEKEYNKDNPEVTYTSLLIGPAYATVLFKDRDPEFFERVQRLVQLGYDRVYNDFKPFPKKYSLGSWIWLNLLMWKMTGDTIYSERAISAAEDLIQIQHKDIQGSDNLKVKGWFYKDENSTKNPWGEKPEQEVMITPWIYQGLFKLIEYLPEHHKTNIWKNTVRMYACDYLLALSRQNSFGYTPMKAEASTGSSLKRKKGDISYQYFANIGRQFHQIGNAAFMMQAANILNDKELADAAWKQVFWFSGNNPMGTSHIYGFGTNTSSQQGPIYRESLARAFPGGTSNGAIGDEFDNPYHNFYNEYYTYANLNVLWLSTIIGAKRFENPIEIWPKTINESPHTATPESHPLDTFHLRIKGGFEYNFMAIVREDPKNSVQWFVNGVSGGNKRYGRISKNGCYKAPFVNDEMKVTIAAVSKKDKTVRDQTEITIYPVPKQIRNLNYQIDSGKIVLSWSPVSANIKGYTIWKRLPSTETFTGTIFEMVGATSYDQPTYTYPNDSIRYYQDHLLPEGTEFIVKAFNYREDSNYVFPPDKYKGVWAGWIKEHKQCPNRIYGFGPASGSVKISYSAIK